MRKKLNKQRLKLDRQVIRYLRNLSENELLQIVGGNSATDPECSFGAGNCEPF